MKNQIARPSLWLSLFVLCLMPLTLFAGFREASEVHGQAVVSPSVQFDGTFIGGTPVQTHVRVLTTKGKLVTSFVTGLDGAFTVMLKPGDYVLVPDSPANPYWQPIQTAVQVTTGEFTTIIIGYYIPPA